MAAPAISLKKNFRWVMAGNLVNAACQWGIVALLAKLASAEILGTYVLVMAIVMPVNTLAKLQLRNIYVTDAEYAQTFSQYLATGSTAAALGLTAMAIWGMTAGYEAQFIVILMAFGASRCLDNPSEILMGYCQKHERMHWIGLGMMLRGITSLAVVALALLWSGSLALMAAALTMAALARIFLYELPVVRRLSRRLGDVEVLSWQWSWPAVRAITAMGIPLGLVLFLGTLANSLIRMVLEAHHGKEQLAYYGAAAYPLMIGTMAVGALGQTVSPRLARLFKERDPRYWRLLGRMTGLASLMGLGVLGGAYWLGKPVLSLLYTPAYGDYHTEFVIMAAGSLLLFVASVLGFGLTAARRFNQQFLASLFTCTTAALLSWGLIPQGGIRAAAWVYLAVAGIQVVVRLVLLFLARRQNPDASPREAS